MDASTYCLFPDRTFVPVSGATDEPSEDLPQTGVKTPVASPANYKIDNMLTSVGECLVYGNSLFSDSNEQNEAMLDMDDVEIKKEPIESEQDSLMSKRVVPETSQTLMDSKNILGVQCPNDIKQEPLEYPCDKISDQELRECDIDSTSVLNSGKSKDTCHQNRHEASDINIFASEYVNSSQPVVDNSKVFPKYMVQNVNATQNWGYPPNTVLEFTDFKDHTEQELSPYIFKTDILGSTDQSALKDLSVKQSVASVTGFSSSVSGCSINNTNPTTSTTGQVYKTLTSLLSSRYDFNQGMTSKAEKMPIVLDTRDTTKGMTSQTGRMPIVLTTGFTNKKITNQARKMPIVLATGHVNQEMTNHSGKAPIVLATRHAIKRMTSQAGRMATVLTTGHINKATNQARKMPIVLATGHADQGMTSQAGKMPVVLRTGHTNKGVTSQTGKTPFVLSTGHTSQGVTRQEGKMRFVLSTSHINKEMTNQKGKLPIVLTTGHTNHGMTSETGKLPIVLTTGHTHHGMTSQAGKMPIVLTTGYNQGVTSQAVSMPVVLTTGHPNHGMTSKAGKIPIVLTTVHTNHGMTSQAGKMPIVLTTGYNQGVTSQALSMPVVLTTGHTNHGMTSQAGKMPIVLTTGHTNHGMTSKAGKMPIVVTTGYNQGVTSQTVAMPVVLTTGTNQTGKMLFTTDHTNKGMTGQAGRMHTISSSGHTRQRMPSEVESRNQNEKRKELSIVDLNAKTIDEPNIGHEMDLKNLKDKMQEDLAVEAAKQASSAELDTLSSGGMTSQARNMHTISSTGHARQRMPSEVDSRNQKEKRKESSVVDVNAQTIDEPNIDHDMVLKNLKDKVQVDLDVKAAKKAATAEVDMLSSGGMTSQAGKMHTSSSSGHTRQRMSSEVDSRNQKEKGRELSIVDLNAKTLDEPNVDHEMVLKNLKDKMKVDLNVKAANTAVAAEVDMLGSGTVFIQVTQNNSLFKVDCTKYILLAAGNGTAMVVPKQRKEIQNLLGKLRGNNVNAGNGCHSDVTLIKREASMNSPNTFRWNNTGISKMVLPAVNSELQIASHAGSQKLLKFEKVWFVLDKAEDVRLAFEAGKVDSSTTGGEITHDGTSINIQKQSTSSANVSINTKVRNCADDSAATNSNATDICVASCSATYGVHNTIDSNTTSENDGGTNEDGNCGTTIDVTSDATKRDILTKDTANNREAYSAVKIFEAGNLVNNQHRMHRKRCVNCVSLKEKTDLSKICHDHTYPKVFDRVKFSAYVLTYNDVEVQSMCKSCYKNYAHTYEQPKNNTTIKHVKRYPNPSKLSAKSEFGDRWKTLVETQYKRTAVQKEKNTSEQLCCETGLFVCETNPGEHTVYPTYPWVSKSNQTRTTPAVRKEKNINKHLSCETGLFESSLPCKKTDSLKPGVRKLLKIVHHCMSCKVEITRLTEKDLISHNCSDKLRPDIVMCNPECAFCVKTNCRKRKGDALDQDDEERLKCICNHSPKRMKCGISGQEQTSVKKKKVLMNRNMVNCNQSNGTNLLSLDTYSSKSLKKRNRRKRKNQDDTFEIGTKKCRDLTGGLGTDFLIESDQVTIEHFENGNKVFTEEIITTEDVPLLGDENEVQFCDVVERSSIFQNENVSGETFDENEVIVINECLPDMVTECEIQELDSTNDETSDVEGGNSEGSDLNNTISKCVESQPPSKHRNNIILLKNQLKAKLDLVNKLSSNQSKSKVDGEEI